MKIFNAMDVDLVPKSLYPGKVQVYYQSLFGDASSPVCAASVHFNRQPSVLAWILSEVAAQSHLGQPVPWC